MWVYIVMILLILFVGEAIYFLSDKMPRNRRKKR